MYKLALKDVVEEVGIKNSPDFFAQIKVKNKPMAHQLEMARKYASSKRWGDWGEPGTGKTLPAHLHGILMATLGNKVVYTMPPKLIEQFEEEMLELSLIHISEPTRQ